MLLSGIVEISDSRSLRNQTLPKKNPPINTFFYSIFQEKST